MIAPFRLSSPPVQSAMTFRADGTEAFPLVFGFDRAPAGTEVHVTEPEARAELIAKATTASMAAILKEGR